MSDMDASEAGELEAHAEGVDKKRKHSNKEERKEKKKHKKDKKEKTKDKKEKKQKKDKKDKKKKHNEEDDAGEDQMVWGERTDFAGGEDNEGGRGDTKGEQKEDTNEAAAVKREDWMMAPPKEAGWLLGGRGKKQEIEEEPDPDNIPVSSRELNPYVAKHVAPEDIPQTSTTPMKVVGDGGASWRARALRRAKESAEADGRELDDVVKERFASVEELTARSNTPRSGDRDRHRGGGGGNRGRFGSSNYLRDERHKMQRPETNDLRWGSRNNTPNKASEDSSSRENTPNKAREDPSSRENTPNKASEDSSRESTPYKANDDRSSREGTPYKASEPRWRTPQKEGDGERGDRDRGGDRGRDREEGRSRQDRGRDREDSDRRRHNNGDGDRGRNNDRDRDRERDRDRNREGDRDRDRDRDRDKPKENITTTPAKEKEVDPKDLSEREREILKEFENQEKSNPYGYSAPKAPSETAPAQSTRLASIGGGGGGNIGGGGGGGGGGGVAIDENKLAALILKAKMKGDKEGMRKLQEQLDNLQQARSEANDDEPDKVVKVIAFDERGRLMSAKKPTAGAAQNDLHKGKRAKTHDDSGQRTRYYADDDVDLQTLVEREKREGVEDFNNAFAKTIVGSKAWKADGNAIDLDDFDDVAPDAMAQVSKNRSKKAHSEKATQQQRAKAISAHNKQESILENCWFCMESTKISKHLIVSLGNKAFLSLPKKGVLAEGHCLIVPIPHAPACTMVDEEVWDEMNNFRKCLIKMFHAQGRDVVFIETAMQFKKQFHTFIECVPLPKTFDLDPAIYFKKAINDSGGEWSQHKKLIDTKARGGIRRSVPKEFPYFSVEFGLGGGGFAHVIEDEVKFSRNFGREVLAGMLDIDESVWLRPKFQTFEEERLRVMAFLKTWDKYDWTKMLDE